MKIISSFKDYYDLGLSVDKDELPIFVRQEKIFAISKANIKITEIYKKISAFNQKLPPCPPGFNKSVVAFCGKVYPFYHYDYLDKSDENKSKTACCFNLNSYKNAILMIDDKKIREAALKYIEDNLNKVIRYFNWKTTENTASSFVNIGKGFTIDDSIFRDIEAPIMITDMNKQHRELIINPRLNKYGFQSCFDPFMAYQELSMYIGNNLIDTSRNIPRPISDKMKAETKGFDIWSFRRHKTDDSKFKKRKT